MQLIVDVERYEQARLVIVVRRLTNMILGIAFAEAVAIYCLVVALLILFVF